MSYHIGDMWSIEATVTDPRGFDPNEPVQPTSFAVTITKPDRSIEVPEVLNIGTGKFFTSVQLTQPGRWHAKFQSSGTYEAGKPKSITVLED